MQTRQTRQSLKKGDTMLLDDYITLIFIVAAVVAFLCLKFVEKKHDEDSYFREQEQRRKDEYRRKTAEASKRQALKDAINEGYSYEDDDSDSDDDNE